ncbi:MAG: thioredoxin-disulfide reductase [Eubacterium sp.]
MYDIIVIGGGPAGLTSAIYARRAGKTVLVIEKETFGGQITYSPLVENYPGVKQMSGNEFADNLLEQAMSLGAEIEVDTVVGIKDGAIKTVETEYSQFQAKSVIIAIGVKHRKLGIKNEDDLIGAGVSYCAVCDGAFYKDKEVAVIGGGNTALADALFLANECAKVYIIHRRSEFRGEEKQVEKLKNNPKIELVLDATVEEILGDSEVIGIRVKNQVTDNIREIKVDGIFVAIGNAPANEVFGNVTALDEAGYIISDEQCMTQTQGIFVAGDCRTKEVRQLTTAAADGAVAALAACKYVG